MQRAVVRSAKIMRVKTIRSQPSQMIDGMTGEEKARKDERMKRESKQMWEAREYNVITHVLLYRDYFFCAFERDHFTNPLSDPRMVLYIATKKQDQLGWF